MNTFIDHKKVQELKNRFASRSLEEIQAIWIAINELPSCEYEEVPEEHSPGVPWGEWMNIIHNLKETKERELVNN